MTMDKRFLKMDEVERLKKLETDEVLRDAFRIEKSDESDSTYLVTGLLSEADGWLDYPESEEVALLISNLIDLELVPGVKSLYVRIDSPVVCGCVYYAKLIDADSESKDSFPKLEIECQVLDTYFVLVAQKPSTGFLTATKNEQDVYEFSFTHNPRAAIQHANVECAKEHLLLARKLNLSEEHPLDVGIVYVLPNRFEITYLGIR